LIVDNTYILVIMRTLVMFPSRKTRKKVCYMLIFVSVLEGRGGEPIPPSITFCSPQIGVFWRGGKMYCFNF